MAPLISFQNVCHRFGEQTVFSQLSFDVLEHETVALIGKGGCGKSLILKMICGLVLPTDGQISVFDQTIYDLSETAFAKLRKEIGFVFQNNALFDAMTVRENVEFPLIRAGIARQEASERAMEQLAQVGLERAAQQWPNELSGGMKKRVCLARALISQPRLILCDDPTAGLDPVTTQRIFRLIQETQKKLSATVLLVSHEIAALRRICKRALLIDAGNVIFDGHFEVGVTCSDVRVCEFLNRGFDPNDE